MWLRDFFAEDLPTCRTMAYGYNTALGHHSIHTIHDYKIDLLEQIKNARTTPEVGELIDVMAGLLTKGSKNDAR